MKSLLMVIARMIGLLLSVHQKNKLEEVAR